MKIKHMFSVFGKSFMFLLHVMDQPKERTSGYTSRVPHSNRHVIPLDYDFVEEFILIDELKALQKEFDLGDFHIFKTREQGYHALCLDEVTLFELRKIILSTSCDIGFKLAPRLDAARNYVLRWDGKGERKKPVYVMTLLRKSKRPQHLGSAKVLFANYGVPLAFLQNSDGRDIYANESYLTAKRLKANG